LGFLQFYPQFIATNNPDGFASFPACATAAIWLEAPPKWVGCSWCLLL
jgi:hypothetical protein